MCLRAFPDFDVVGQAADGISALQICQETLPDVVLMDIYMPDMDGVMATRLIRAQFPEVKVVAITSSSSRADVQSMLNAGAIGYIFKDVDIDQLADVIRLAASGRPLATGWLMQSPIDPSTSETGSTSGDAAAET